MSHTIIQSRHFVKAHGCSHLKIKKKTLLTCTKMSILLGQTACITTTKSEYKHFSEKAGGGDVEGGAERLLFAGVGLGYPKLSVGNFGIFTNM